LRAFRVQHPGGANYVVVTDTPRPFTRRYGDLEARFLGLADLVEALAA
jgi:hypothetical protein